VIGIFQFFCNCLQPASGDDSGDDLDASDNDGNSVTGTLPAYIGELSALTMMNFGKHSLRRDISCHCLGSLFLY
jgi:hypothetical protein